MNNKAKSFKTLNFWDDSKTSTPLRDILRYLSRGLF